MRVTIFGATGLLGKALVRHWQSDDVTGLSSSDADVRDPAQVKAAIESSRPDWVVLAAAYTDVDGCESNRDLAFAVNRDGALNVARAAGESGSRLLFVSTDYVFDGKGRAPYATDHPRAPQSIYGRSKAEAEAGILEILPEACIARTSWLFGHDGKCFPDTMLKLAERRRDLEVVDDQRGSPTFADDLATAIIGLTRKGARGIVHVTNRGECSWFEFAEEIFRQSGTNIALRPTTSDKFVRPASRPSYSVLSPASLEAYGIKMPDWKDALQRYLTVRQKEQNATPEMAKSGGNK